MESGTGAPGSLLEGLLPWRKQHGPAVASCSGNSELRLLRPQRAPPSGLGGESSACVLLHPFPCLNLGKNPSMQPKRLRITSFLASRALLGFLSNPRVTEPR